MKLGTTVVAALFALLMMATSGTARADENWYPQNWQPAVMQPVAFYHHRPWACANPHFRHHHWWLCH